MKRWRLIFELILVVAVVVLSILLHKSKQPVDRGSHDISERIINRLQKQLDDYRYSNEELQTEIFDLKMNIEYLKKLKAQKEIIYIEKIKRIESLNVNDQVKEYQVIFERNNLK